MKRSPKTALRVNRKHDFKIDDLHGEVGSLWVTVPCPMCKRELTFYLENENDITKEKCPNCEYIFKVYLTFTMEMTV
jgi:ribosomal protein S27E